MTTGESIDNTNMENVTVTSDEAFERVTSNESFEEEGGEGYLRQNTSGLVQEIPNISFLDIADTMLESKKTFHDRKNWILRVGNAGKSVEAQPQDTITLRLDSNKTFITTPGYTDENVDFDSSVSSLNYTTCEPDNTYLFNGYKIKILQTGYYRISYGWTIEPNDATNFEIGAYSNSQFIASDRFMNGTYPEVMSGGKTVSNIKLNEGDIVVMHIYANGSITAYKNNTYLDIQFQQYIL